MIYRSTSYDGIGIAITSLRDAQKRRDNFIQKSENAQKCVDCEALLSHLVDTIYKMFLDLKKDYYQNECFSQARYMSYLKIIYDELTGDQKIDVPEIHADEMIQEMRKFWNNLN